MGAKTHFDFFLQEEVRRLGGRVTGTKSQLSNRLQEFYEDLAKKEQPSHCREGGTAQCFEFENVPGVFIGCHITYLIVISYPR